LTSAQRIEAYTKLEIEDDLTKLGDKKEWPVKGSVKFDGVAMKYREHMEPAVTDLSFEA